MISIGNKPLSQNEHRASKRQSSSQERIMENNNTSTAKTPSSSSSSSSKLRSKILKILPKAAAAVTMTFQNPPFSPGRDHHKPRSDHNNASSAITTTTTRLKPHGNKGFSGPIMILDEVRRKQKDGDGIETQEPTSPKVSCIGQIKHNKKKQIKKQDAKSMSLPVVATTPKEESVTRKTEEKKMKKQGSKRFQRMLIFYTGKPKTGVRKSSASPSSVIGGERNTKDGASDNNAPPIGYMRRFASGRETFANFDWKAQIAPEEMNRRDFYSEDNKAESDAGEEDEEEEEEEIMIPFSAPIGGRGGGGNGGFGGGFGGGGGVNMANLQPRKEINLWKRRTMAQPRPLQLNPVLTASSK